MDPLPLHFAPGTDFDTFQGFAQRLPDTAQDFAFLHEVRSNDCQLLKNIYP